MAKIFAIVFALCAFQYCLAKPAQDTKASIDKLSSDTKAALDDLQKKFEQNTPTIDEFVQTLNTHSQQAANQISTWAKQLKDEGTAHEGQVNQALQDARAKLVEVANSLEKAAGPDVTKKASEWKQTFESNLEAARTQLKKLADEATPTLKSGQDNINKFLQDSFNQMNALIESTKKDIDTKIQEHQKTHKH